MPTASTEDQLLELFETTFYDPEAFVMAAFPWGEPGTFLEDETGPDEWQAALLRTVKEQIIKAEMGLTSSKNVRIAVSSGHSSGKSTVLVWIIMWFITTRYTPQIQVTAGTKTQLTTKLWRELAKWHEVAIHNHWFEHTATTYKLKDSPATWSANAIPWSKSNPHAIAGAHEKYVLIVFDEGSTIDDIIYDTVEGATAKLLRIWLVFGNPTKFTGRFRDCWGRFRDRWITFEVDCRKAKHADQDQIREWIEDYGLDSDFVRVRVLGQPPRSGTLQFIPTELVEAAMARKPDHASVLETIPRIFGVDVGGSGQAKTVIFPRMGPVTGWEGLSNKILDLHEPDLMKVAAWIALQINTWAPDIVFIDANGLGKGVYDRLVQLGYDNVVACYWGDRSQVLEPRIWYNPRMEWWNRGREWLKTGSLPQHPMLRDDLTTPEHYPDINHIMRLETKEQMADRTGAPSPDYADAFMHTFAQLVPMKFVTRGSDAGMSMEPEVV